MFNEHCIARFLSRSLNLGPVARVIGIDPSQGMLNSLVVKYPHLAGVHPMTFGQALQQRVLGGTKFDLVLALGGAGTYLSERELDGLMRHADGPVVLSVYAEGERPEVGDLSAAQLAEDRARVLDVAGARGWTRASIGRLDVVVGSQL